MKFSTYFDKESYNKDLGTTNDMESLTDQSFKSNADINELVLMYQNGMAPRTGTPVYNMENYETANWTFEDWQNQKAMIERKFLHLSPDLQAKFVTPANFFKYCSNPENFIITENGVEKKPDPVPEVPPVVEKGPEQIPEP